ncbi:DNA-binding GntR family transcriptional regulator [Paraburkholderia bannensis]|uniref:DNA-binding GntR family transcriptional regulator n=1 Tax=Paraburkholderia bannensis TaxID=765414 RepID=A0A7W9TZI9_9BURK|nr:MULTISPECIES: GntR family transcriptional regulator [Paraburkholderia]MBB3259266.1 DNA-binding GntR family transcriptional regulator [Paraburkholderia sp. WP4_3_2]MBB6104282.1 DNA-binding GntR family transcriptional regulator [Paraburkholderia bannensis]
MSNNIESTTTQQDTTYATLRQWVTVGRFLPGERLKIRNVAAEMGVGQMPVRAALQRLAAEGALVNVPNAGMIVPRLTLPEFDDLLQMRMLLEGEAAERGCLRLEPAELATLRKLCQRMGKALKTPTDQPPRARTPERGKQTLKQPAVSLKADQPTDYLAANEEFHVLLYKAAGSPLLFELIDTLWLKAGPISNRLFDASEASAVLNDAHEDLMDALDRRDAAAARRAVERDIFVAGQFLRSTLKRA